jgi:archaellum biogenesis protein FlaJ (TadC family)
MKGLANLSPMQLACLALSGSFAPSIAFWLPIMPGSNHRDAWSILGVVLFATGILFLFRVPPELESGIANRRWPESQVEKLRSILNSRAITIVLFMLLIACVVMVFLPQRSFRRVTWAFMLPVQSLSLLRLACKEPKPQGPFERLDWKSIPPLQSQHWGER